MIAFDTTALIDFFKEDRSLMNLIKEVNDGFVTTSINCQEIYFGINPKDSKHLLEEETFDNFFKDIIVLDFDKDCAKQSSKIFWDLSEKGQPIGKFDCMIAGILLFNRVTTIITKNKNHFEKIKGLKVLDY